MQKQKGYLVSRKVRLLKHLLVLGAVLLCLPFDLRDGVQAYTTTNHSISVLGTLPQSQNYKIQGGLKIAGNVPGSRPNDATTSQPVVTSSASTPTTGGSSGGGDNRKYDSSNWNLARKYKELVAKGRAEKEAQIAKDSQPKSPAEPLRASAPKEKIPAEVPQKAPVETPEKKLEKRKEVAFVVPPVISVVPPSPKAPIIRRDKEGEYIEKIEFVRKEAGGGVSERVPVGILEKKMGKPVLRVCYLNQEIPQNSKFFGGFPFFGDVQQITFEDENCDLYLKDGGYILSLVQQIQFSYVWGDLLFIFLVILLINNICFFVYIRRQMALCRREASGGFTKTRMGTKKRARALKKRLSNVLKVLVLAGVLALMGGQGADAATTGPPNILYEGYLRDNQGNLVNGAYDFRLSVWTSADFANGDTTASSGEINAGAATFLGWQEVHSKQVQDGFFSLELGTSTPMPNDLFDRNNTYLQVDVKQSAQSALSFELLDADAQNPNKDRLAFFTVPYAMNADKVDFRELGQGAGNIPYLDPNAQLPKSAIPGGTNDNYFLLDANGTATAQDTLAITFGNSLQKSLAWNGLLQQFEFNDTVAITGNLTVTGTINNITVGQKPYTKTMAPQYENSIFAADGTNNSGSMYEDTETLNGKKQNVVRWETIKPTIQDYDVQIKYALPSNFISFAATNPLSLDLRTVGTVSQSKVDITVEKEGGDGTDQIGGSGAGLSSNTWVTQAFGLNTTTTWSPGDIMLIRIKLSATSTFQAYIGDLKIHLVAQ